MKTILALLATTFMAITATANVRWLTSSHDFGAFREVDGKVSTTFKFINTGKEPIGVRGVRASCGCTSSSFTKTPIEPGDTGEIVATFNPAGRPGRFTKTLTVDIEGEARRKTLDINGVVIGSEQTLRSRYPVECGPLRFRTDLVPFGTVLKGKAKSAFVEVYNATVDTVTPIWTGVHPDIRIASSQGSIAPGQQVVYSLVLIPNSQTQYGIMADSIYIGAPGAPDQKLDITAIVEEDFSRLTPGQLRDAPAIAVSTDRLLFDTIDPAAGPQTRTFEITNQGKNELLLHRVYTTDSGVEVEANPAKIKKGKSAMVKVTADPAQIAGDLLSARIQIIANDPNQPITIVRAIGEIKR